MAAIFDQAAISGPLSCEQAGGSPAMIWARSLSWLVGARDATQIETASVRLTGWPLKSVTDGGEGGPTDRPEDANVAMDRDWQLRWPASKAIQAWWAQREGGFRRVAFLMDGPAFVEFCQRPGMEIVDHQKSWSVYFSDPYGHPLEVTTYDYDYVAGQR